MRSLGRRAAAVAWAAGGAVTTCAAVSMTAAPETGCYTHRCDPSTATFPGPPPEDGGLLEVGRMIDDDTYETNALDEPWIPYPPNVTLNVTFPSGLGSSRVPVSIDSYIGISSTPNDSSDGAVNFTTAAGGVVEYDSLNSTGFQAINTTCSMYWARFVVHFAPASTGDAG